MDTRARDLVLPRRCPPESTAAYNYGSEGRAVKPYYADDAVTLYLGDCREVLPELGVTADCIVADPPYGETSLAWDRWPHGWVEVAASVSRSMWCFGSLRMFMQRAPELTAAGWKLSHDAEAEWVDHAAWEKHNGSGFAADRLKKVHELAGHFYRGPWRNTYHEVPRVPAVHKRGGQRFTRAQPAHTGTIAGTGYDDDGLRLVRSVIRAHRPYPAIHPTEKPGEVLSPLIEYGCPPGGLIIAPFAGSGSDLATARALGRRAIGVEGDEAQAEKAALRLSEATLFGGAA